MDWQVPSQQFYTPYQNNVAMHGMGMGHGSYQMEGQPSMKRLGYR